MQFYGIDHYFIENTWGPFPQLPNEKIDQFFKC